MTPPRLLCSLPILIRVHAVCLVLGTVSQVFAQFATVINVPPDSAPNGITSNTQLNLFDGGFLPADFVVGIGAGLQNNMEVNITGGVVGDDFTALSGSSVYISGGLLGQRFRSFNDSTVTLAGGELRLNGRLVDGLENPGDTISLGFSPRLNGTLADGTPFAITRFDSFFANSGVTLELSTVPPVGPALIRTSTDNIPVGIRQGQTLVVDGGAVADRFIAGFGATVEIESGSVGLDFKSVGAKVNMSGGTIDDGFQAVENATVGISAGSIGSLESDDSTITISGGTVDALFAFGGSTVDVTGGMVGIERINVADGSTLNLAGGEIVGRLRVDSGAHATISAGKVGESFIVEDLSTAVISGGTIADGFRIQSGTVTISGGVVGNGFTADRVSTVNITGGNFGSNFGADGRVTIAGGVFGEGVKAVGTVSISDGTFGDNFTAGRENSWRPTSVTTIKGGEFGNSFVAKGRVRISGATIGSFDANAGSEVAVYTGHLSNNLNVAPDGSVAVFGGSIAGTINAQSESRLTIAGGSLAEHLRAFESSEILLVGTDFRLDGMAFDELANPGDSVLVTARDGLPLTGSLRDGTVFNFHLNPVLDEANTNDFFHPNATVRLMLPIDCDYDFDGICEVDDLDILLGASGGDHVNFDLDENGTVDTGDAEVWLANVGVRIIGRPLLMGDANFDGKVDAADIAHVGLNWQSSVSSWSHADFNGDGFVGAMDLNLMARNWQRGVRAAPLPEPSALFLSLIGATMVLCRRRSNEPFSI